MQIVFLLLSFAIGLSNYEDGVSAKQITHEEFIKAYSLYKNYNQQLDTSIMRIEKDRVREAIAQSLEGREKEWLATDDFEICSIGKYRGTNEYYAQLLWASEEQAVFLRANMSLEQPRILGSVYGVYSSTGFYAGAKGQDCDNYAHIFIYTTNKSGEKKLSVVYENPNVVCDEGDELSSPPPLFWYKTDLFCRFRNNTTNAVVYYKLQLILSK